ncbi:MAG: beta-galactosidase [Treponema sp. GWB1_62_6]|nr:MAG: beta-galactosidase [Treponema sp. GWB1_62_6]
MEAKALRLPALLHGGDYNPDQWLDRPDILAEDIRLMKLAGCNAMSVGIFAWSALEPREGRFEFAWLDSVIDSLHANGISVILATPSGARPAWMARKYPEVLRVTSEGVRRRFGERHNHCFSSPVYREKVARIDTLLAERYGRHPGVILWHVSNEYSGDCRCPLCVDAFRSWLRDRYGNLEKLNRDWWTSFWSHGFSEWEEIDPPSTIGETMLHGLDLDWKRFVTWRTIDFMEAEIAAIRAVSPDLPVTTNLMGTFEGLDYFELAEHIDVASWDNYAGWHGRGPRTSPWTAWDPEGRDWRLASEIGFVHDLTRSLKRKPFLLMESTPSATNWQPVAKLKRPGMNALSSLQAVAHGSDSVLYFQWRKSRGGFEKFHGAVVDHEGTEDNRVFREVAELGGRLAELADVAGTGTRAEAAIYFDWENRWAMEGAKGPRNDGLLGYKEDCLDHYYRLWRRSVTVDVVDRRADFSRYKLVVLPMAYMMRDDTAARLAEFVSLGGTLVGTYWSGIVDEHDLCRLGGFPGPLRPLFGLRAEEIDALYPDERRTLTMEKGNALGFEGSFESRHLWEAVRPEGAEVLARFDADLFAGMPAVCVNSFGKGRAYYLASRNDERFLDAFYASVLSEVRPARAWPDDLPEGVSATVRHGGGGSGGSGAGSGGRGGAGRNSDGAAADYRFLMNFTEAEVELAVPAWPGPTKLLSGTARMDGKLLILPRYGWAVLRTDALRTDAP